MFQFHSWPIRAFRKRASWCSSSLATAPTAGCLRRSGTPSHTSRYSIMLLTVGKGHLRFSPAVNPSRVSNLKISPPRVHLTSHTKLVERARNNAAAAADVRPLQVDLGNHLASECDSLGTSVSLVSCLPACSGENLMCSVCLGTTWMLESVASSRLHG